MITSIVGDSHNVYLVYNPSVHDKFIGRVAGIDQFGNRRDENRTLEGIKMVGWELTELVLPIGPQLQLWNVGSWAGPKVLAIL